jgi:hypothetical protein
MTHNGQDDEVLVIGDVAGRVWHYLHSSGPASLTQLIKQIDASRDTVLQAIGWLAREGKISIHKAPRSKRIQLV